MSFLDFLFPKKCVNCRKFGDFLCADCFAQIKYTDFIHDSLRDLDEAISVVSYSGVVKNLVRQFKYKPHVSRLGEIISEIMNEGLAQNEVFYNFVSKYNPTIIPVPLSPKRLRERGYNHAEIIASYVAKYFNLKMETGILVRIKDTKPQYKLNKDERRKNIEGAFAVRKNPNTLYPEPRRRANIPKAVMLIDDVATTFATLNEAARVLRRNGSKQILGVTFAREL